jgi:hypothetical protein
MNRAQLELVTSEIARRIDLDYFYLVGSATVLGQRQSGHIVEIVAVDVESSAHFNPERRYSGDVPRQGPPDARHMSDTRRVQDEQTTPASS